MDLFEFPDINIDQLLDASTTPEDGFLAPHSKISVPQVNEKASEKRSRLAERIAECDDLIRQVLELKSQNKQLADLQLTAQEVSDLYQKEKHQRLELQKQSQQLGERCAELEKELDAQVINCENLQEQLQIRALPVDAKEVLTILLQLEQRLGDDAGLVRRDQIIVKKLKEYCKTASISLPTPKSPTARNKRRSQATQTDAEPLPEKPTMCSVSVQVENLIQTRDQGTQHKNPTTTRGTTTASFIKKHDVGTTFPEPKPLPNVHQILDEMLSWQSAPLSPLNDLLPEVVDISPTASVGTCTTLCDIHREIDFMAELPPQIKVSASRPPSRTMLDSVKEEARSSRELTKELLNFLPQNQSCLANLPPQAFEELWQVFGQMVLGLLQRRSNPAMATVPTVSQLDFTSWLYELYEDTQGQPEQIASKKDFSASAESMDVGTDPIIASPNISHGGDVTPIRLPLKPKERKRKSKKRKAAASQTSAKRTCQVTMEPAEDHGSSQESVKGNHEQEPETAIQFLSNLNTFNMANCDNLDMELDEEELYLLQLTSRPAMQADEEQAKEGEDLPAVPAEGDASLKDEKPENSEWSDCKEAEEEPEEPEELPNLCLEERDLSLIKSNACLQLEYNQRDIETLTNLPKETNPSQPVCSSAKFELKNKPEVKEHIASLPDVQAESPPDTHFNGSASTCKELSVVKEHLSLLTAEYFYSSDSNSDSEEDTLPSVRETVGNTNACKSLKNKEEISSKQKHSSSYLFGSDSDSESELSDEQLYNHKTKWSPKESEEGLNASETERSEEQLPEEDNELDAIESEEEPRDCESESGEDSTEKFSESDSETGKDQLSPKEDLTECKDQTSEKDNDLDAVETAEGLLGFDEPVPTNIQISDESEDYDGDGEKDKLNEKLPLAVTEATAAVLVPEIIPSLPLLSTESASDLERYQQQVPIPVTSPALSSSDDESLDDNKLVIDDSLPPSGPEPENPPPVVTGKRKRTVSEKSPATPVEGRLTRQRAKQFQIEHNLSTESRTPLVEQIRTQLKQAISKTERLKRVCNLPAVRQKTKKQEDPQPDQSYKCNYESPASPISQPIQEELDSIPEIPLKQAVVEQKDGPPKSILQHVIDQYKGDAKLSEMRRKTLGKSQQQLCASIGKYLSETLELEALSLEVYKLTKEEAVIVNALIVVITRMNIEGNPLERLLSALKYFEFTKRFLAELEERLFRNTKERPPTELTMKYVKLYLAAVSHTVGVNQDYTNPARLLLAKLIYHYEQDMPETVLEVLRQFPTVLPHREERQYDHSDPLITVMKHLLMSRTYDMQDKDGAERLLLSKLRFEYHFQPFEPNKQQVLENLVEKLKAGRSLEQLGYAFALFCRRSPGTKVVELVVMEHLMPLATSYCDLAEQEESYDDRIVVLLQSISMVLKPLPLDTDISAFVGLVKRLIVAVPRPGVQQAAVQACLRLQRFGFQTVRDALQSYRPNYPMEPLTRAMMLCYAGRRKQYHCLAKKGKAGRK